MLTVGQILRNVRVKKNIPLHLASKETRIQQKYLEALEDNNWNSFSSKVYISGVLRSYSSYLGLDPDKVLAYFRRDYEKKDDKVRFQRKLPSLNLLPETKKIVIVAISSLVAFFFIYFGYQFMLYLRPPDVKILAPQQEIFRNTAKIRIIGQTQKESSIRIFNQEVFPDESGMFQYDLPLQKGANPVDVFVIGANGKETVIKKIYTLE